MYLIVGRSEDSFCRAIQDSLRAANQECLILGELFHAPGRAAVTISDRGASVQCKGVEGGWLDGNDISGVYVRELVYPDVSSWSPEDYDYVVQEITSSFLSWLAALPCPVLNRYDPRTWNMRYSSALAWRLSARRCGLEIYDRWEKRNGFSAQSRLYRVAVIDQELIWDLIPPLDHEQLGKPLRLFMELNRVVVLEAVFNFELDRSQLFSIGLELCPQRFSPTTKQQILERIVALLLHRSKTTIRSR
jgi:hypothetical protein